MEKTNMVIAFIFDSGKLGDSFYGRVVFEHMLKDKEIASNTIKTVISTGDLSIYSTYIDIEPYLINDEICTVEIDKLDKTHPFTDYPYCWIVEDIDICVAQNIDKRLKDTLPGYIGITKIDPLSEDEYKQFWKKLPRTFAISGNKILVFQNPELTSPFIFEELSKKLGYDVEYVPEAEYLPIEDSSVKQSSFVTCEADRYIKGGKHSRSSIEGGAMCASIDKRWSFKNFNMVAELDISGEFIYNGIHNIYSISHFSNDGSTFCALYNISVGIERLQKIVYVLWGMDSYDNDEEFERSLITHSHTGLRDRIIEILNESGKKISFCERENDLFSILQHFYNHTRYSRFNVEGDWNEELSLLREFAIKYDLIDKSRDWYPESYLVATPEMKEIIGRTIGSISHKFFNLIKEGSSRNSTFTYELRSGSKAEKIFLGKHDKNSLMQVQIDESIALKELLIYFRNSNTKNAFLHFVDEIEPLDFDPAMAVEYLEEIFKGEIPQTLIDDVECMYVDNNVNIGDRIQLMGAFANTSVFYEYPQIKEGYSVIERIITNKTVQDEDIDALIKCKEYISEDEIVETIEAIIEIAELYRKKKLEDEELISKMCSFKNDYKQYLINQDIE